MTPAETVKLLGLCAAFDNRTIGRADAAAWHEIVGEYPFSDAREAVIAYYRDQRDRIMPSDVRRGVSVIRRARVERLRDEDLIPDADLMLGPRMVARALQLRRALVLDGMSVEDAARHPVDP